MKTKSSRQFQSSGCFLRIVDGAVVYDLAVAQQKEKVEKKTKELINPFTEPEHWDPDWFGNYE